MKLITGYLAVLLFTWHAINAAPDDDTQNLVISAVISDRRGFAHIQCWRLSTPFTRYPTVGKAIELGDTSNMTYVVLPPRSGEGYHNPPHPMFFVLLSGLAHVVAPHSGQELLIREGVNPLIVATDIKGVGHLTYYPSDKETIALQVPFKGGVEPEHIILHEGACNSSSSSSIQGQQLVVDK